jgi:hypothetical protein
MASRNAKAEMISSAQIELRAVCDEAAEKYGVEKLPEMVKHGGVQDEFSWRLSAAEAQLALMKFTVSLIEAATAGAVKGGGE